MSSASAELPSMHGWNGFVLAISHHRKKLLSIGGVYLASFGNRVTREAIRQGPGLCSAMPHGGFVYVIRDWQDRPSFRPDPSFARRKPNL